MSEPPQNIPPQNEPAPHIPEAPPPQPTPRPRPRPPSVMQELGMLFAKVAVIAAIFAGVFTFVYGIHRVVGPHMSPMVMDSDLVLFFRLQRNFDIGDLVLLRYDGQIQVRRIVAQAGDTVDINQHGLVVNNALIHEPLIFEETWPLETTITFPLTLAPGQIFVLGDARESAIDSRVYGPIDTSDTLGTVITVMRRRGM